MSEAGQGSVQTLEKRLRTKWRRVILKRDGTCRACLPEFSVSAADLQLAHVTPMSAFKAALGERAGAAASFRLDNLVLLCSACHAAQESALNGTSRIPSAALQPGCKRGARKLPPTADVHRDLEFERRLKRVATLFGEVEAERGWIAVDDPGRLT